MKTVAFVPIKLNNERLPGKNVMRFTNGEPLISYILNTLKKVAEIDEIYVYCSSESIIQYIPEDIQFLKRDDYLDLSSTPFINVVTSFAQLVDADTYVLAHATAPFISGLTISRCINAVNVDGYDSAFSVLEMQEFLWKNGKPVNYSLDNIPRTQDLDKIMLETCGLYVFTKHLISDNMRRIGTNPFLMPISKIESCDINTPEDFLIADAIYNHIILRSYES